MPGILIVLQLSDRASNLRSAWFKQAIEILCEGYKEDLSIAVVPSDSESSEAPVEAPVDAELTACIGKHSAGWMMIGTSEEQDTVFNFVQTQLKDWRFAHDVSC